jgi:hypothetical protein
MAVSGQYKSDIEIGNTLRNEHRLYELLICIDNSGSLKGVQATAAVPQANNTFNQTVTLNQFGNL